jgi:HD-GYP domain-containing protein (c-di-GMP phosphodiesterase class II)
MDQAALERRCGKLSSILEIARALAVERDLDSLLAMILQAAAHVAEADRCSIFLVDRDRNDLWTRLAQGVGTLKEIRTPLGVGIAGHVASTGEAINIPDAYADSRFNRAIDQATGYRTRNILTVPMRRAGGDEAGQVVGVLQALNRLDGKPFNEEDQELLEGLGGQAASAIDNAILHQEIQRLFEGFVHASVVAIESRDPTTAGHSERVAKLTVQLAKNLQSVEKGPYAGHVFSDEQLQEIRYAGLLHDFGKVGVREHVLVKANKLYPHELEILEGRFALILRTAELESSRRQLALQRERPGDLEARLHEEETRLAAQLVEIEGLLEFVRTCNRPTVLAQGGFERLHEVAARSFQAAAGPLPFLTEAEVVRLSITKGSLSEEERREIESHVTHTYRFLSQIPWTRTLRRIPEIAYGHHEKLDGRGYPRKLEPGAIGLETRMMTISDIYDALTASDRPYKKAVPHEKALDILASEAKSGQLDPELFSIFVEAKVPALVLGLGSK